MAAPKYTAAQNAIKRKGENVCGDFFGYTMLY